MIYHWCPESDWEATAAQYTPADFSRDGFVHCSFLHQVAGTASALERGRDDLVLLCIDESDLTMVVEDCYRTGEEYPHVYDRIPAEAVIEVLHFPPERDGSFRVPADAPAQ